MTIWFYAWVNFGWWSNYPKIWYENNHLATFTKVEIKCFRSAITNSSNTKRDVIFAWPLTENIVLLVECEYDKVVLCCNCTLHTRRRRKNISKLWHFKLARTYAHTHKDPFNKSTLVKHIFLSGKCRFQSTFLKIQTKFSWLSM